MSGRLESQNDRVCGRTNLLTISPACWERSSKSVAQACFRVAWDSHASSSRLRFVRYCLSQRTREVKVDRSISIRIPLKIFLWETRTRATSRTSSCTYRKSWTFEKVRLNCGFPPGVSLVVSSRASRLCRRTISLSKGSALRVCVTTYLCAYLCVQLLEVWLPSLQCGAHNIAMN